MRVGSAVKNLKEGDVAAVGCMVDSCGTCASCLAGEEQYCEAPSTLTYNSEDRHLGGVTYGGYSDSIVVDESFVLRVSDKADLAGTAPLLCAGITTYSPLRHWNVDKGQKVGVVEFGGLGHMGVKFANAFGAHVVLFTTSPDKTADALRVGAHEVVVSKNEGEMQKHLGSFDFILDTVSAEHNVSPYLELLKRLLAGQRPGMEDVARELHLSPRTLQRRLAQEGATFQQLIQQARRELARHYLLHSSLELNETAYLLGYEDANSFFRAFHHWEGTSPGQWRATQTRLSPGGGLR